MPQLAEDTRTAARQVLDESIALEYERGLTVPDFDGEGAVAGIPDPPPGPGPTPTIVPAVVKDGAACPLDPAEALPDGTPVAIVIAR